jgi:hypothetical protein
LSGYIFSASSCFCGEGVTEGCRDQIAMTQAQVIKKYIVMRPERLNICSPHKTEE